MIDKFEVTVDSLTGTLPRTAYVYLPEDYNVISPRRYPVLYMFDGHNVFFDEDATYGKSWGMGDFLDAVEADVIVAAVECNHEGNGRLSEYSPVPMKFKGEMIEPHGKETMDWFVEAFKPYIDSHYKTIPDREHTAIAGSSMGGLMTLYALTVYNDVFGMGAALSPSLWLGGKSAVQFIKEAEIIPGTRIYMDYGSEETKGRRGAARAFRTVTDLLLKKGAYLTARVVPGGTHTEASWERQIPFFMEALGLIE